MCIHLNWTKLILVLLITNSSYRLIGYSKTLLGVQYDILFIFIRYDAFINDTNNTKRFRSGSNTF